MKIILILSLITLLTACSHFFPEKQPESKAKQVASSAGFSFRDIRREHIIENIDLETLSLLNYGAGLNRKYTNPARPIKNSIFAWMPKNLAIDTEEARIKFRSILLESAKASLKDQNLEYRQYAKENKDILALAFKNDAWGCDFKDNQWCYIYISIDYFKLSDDPLFFQEGIGYALNHHKNFSGSNSYNVLKVVNKPAIENFDLDILLSFSKHLPDWVYLYLAPSEIIFHNGIKLAFPMMIQSGKPLLFLAKEKSDGKLRVK